MSAEDDKGFLARWSRLKRSDPEKPEGKPGSPARSTAEAPDAAKEPAFDVSTLPKIEDLTPSSDIAAFLQKGVPEELKRLALRRIWSLDPAIRDFIEVAENQYDWNAIGGVPGFGEITPGTDIAALLRQAIGQTPEPVVGGAAIPDTVEVGAADTAQAHTDIAASQQEKSAGESADVPHDDALDAAHQDGSEPPASCPNVTEELRSSPHAPLSPRTRHGGALPSLADDKLG